MMPFCRTLAALLARFLPNRFTFERIVKIKIFLFMLGCHRHDVKENGIIAAKGAATGALVFPLVLGLCKKREPFSTPFLILLS